LRRPPGSVEAIFEEWEAANPLGGERALFSTLEGDPEYVA
jgi:hypothetical protein